MRSKGRLAPNPEQNIVFLWVLEPMSNTPGALGGHMEGIKRAHGGQLFLMVLESPVVMR